MGDSFHVALLHPGDAAWTSAQRNGVSIYRDDRDCCCVAYRDGRIVLCAGSSWRLLPAQAKAAAGGSQTRWMPHEPTS
ncbi:hypothetical protein C2845_PM02G15830 [Panicum miliaceum]|uniref:Uncharacterized protein n=1 Tax=Panicum miliaceum TaxID=4540 RepID=A0A3L6SDT2_PANMI|nr:hypothetical protein C2845_PM02G15830 [Panicum miliaceum]